MLWVEGGGKAFIVLWVSADEALPNAELMTAELPQS